jgi:hypothetical protein
VPSIAPQSSTSWILRGPFPKFFICTFLGKIKNPITLKNRSFFFRCLSLVRGTIRRLTETSIGIGAHFHPNRLQHLFDSHVPIPIFHGREFARLDLAGLIDTIHVDFRDESNDGWFGRVVVVAVNSELIKSIRVMSLLCM